MTHTPPGTSPNATPPVRARAGQLLLAGFGAFVALSIVGLLAEHSEAPWIIGSFGASCVLLFGFPKGPFSQARNVIGGHVLCSCIGLVCLYLLGPGAFPMALACALALMLMALSGTLHPPAGGNPILVFMLDPGWTFAVTPTLAGAVLITLVAWLYWKAVEALGKALL